jgi:hypothetical protein
MVPPAGFAITADPLSTMLHASISRIGAQLATKLIGIDTEFRASPVFEGLSGWSMACRICRRNS